jgi:hypothetical protein
MENQPDKPSFEINNLTTRDGKFIGWIATTKPVRGEYQGQCFIATPDGRKGVLEEILEVTNGSPEVIIGIELGEWCSAGIKDGKYKRSVDHLVTDFDNYIGCKTVQQDPGLNTLQVNFGGSSKVSIGANTLFPSLNSTERFSVPLGMQEEARKMQTDVNEYWADQRAARQKEKAAGHLKHRKK